MFDLTLQAAPIQQSVHATPSEFWNSTRLASYKHPPPIGVMRGTSLLSA